MQKLISGIWKSSGLFMATVVLPTAAAAIYFGAIASDAYVSESRFVVHSAERGETPSLGSLFKGMGAAGSENALMVRDFLQSREVIEGLDRNVGLRASYKEGDFLSRFPGLLDADTSEDFYEFYKKQVVKADVDPQSSVTTLSVRGFQPEVAVKANRFLLSAAESMVDGVNKRIRRDTLSVAEEEVRLAEDRVRKAEDALSVFRVSHRLIDPEKQAALQLQGAQEIEKHLVAAESKLAQVRAVARNSPQILVLEHEVQSLRRAIGETEGRVTGGARSLASNSPAYQRLALEREIAAKQLAVAMEGLNRARVEAGRKHVYLEKIAGPSRPDGSLEPRRLRGVLATLVISLLAWGVLSVLLAGIREHKEVV